MTLADTLARVNARLAARAAADHVDHVVWAYAASPDEIRVALLLAFSAMWMRHGCWADDFTGADPFYDATRQFDHVSGGRNFDRLIRLSCDMVPGT